MRNGCRCVVWGSYLSSLGNLIIVVRGSVCDTIYHLDLPTRDIRQHGMSSEEFGFNLSPSPIETNECHRGSNHTCLIPAILLKNNSKTLGLTSTSVPG